MVTTGKKSFFRDHPVLTEVLAKMAMASGIGYVAVAYSISRWLTRPARRRPQQTPEALGLPWEELECRTADRLRLVGWAVHPPRPRGTVAIFHGIRHTREETLGRIAFLTAAGYRCVAFDHRAHGESAGQRTSFGFQESRDVAAVLDLVQQRWPHQPRVALGISMGAAAICFASSHSRLCDAIILESCYRDIGSAFQNRLSHGFPPWYKKISRAVIWFTERRLGLRIHQLAPANHVHQLTPAPVLLLTGTEDRHATPDEVRQLYERCQEPREFWLVPNAQHRDVVEVGGLAYQQRILEFLEQRLTQRQAA